MEWGSKRVLPEVKQIIGIMLITAFMYLITGVYSTALDESSIVNEVSSLRMMNCSLEPERITGLVEGGEATVAVNCTSAMTELMDDVNVVLWHSVDDAQIAEVVGGWPRICYFDRTWNETMNCSLSVRGLFLGRTTIRIRFAAYSSSELSSVTIAQTAGSRGESAAQSAWVHVSVIRKERIIDHLFLGLVTLMVIIANVGMGCKIELPVVKEVLRRPIAPVIGFCCQYLIMPLTAFAVLKMVGLTGGLALGYFAAGCAPGGGSSNMYTFLLGGDVSLSVTMTLISILASIGMIPLWLYTLGRLLIDPDTQITIPFANIMTSLLCILIPIIIGLAIQRWWKRGAAFIVKTLRPVYIVFILLMFTLGVWSNLFIFRVISPMLILAGCLLPYVGFLLSGIVAFLLQQPKYRVLTIAIETGIQNTGLAIIMMKFSLPQPEGDLSIAAPITVAMFMPFPLWIAVTVVEIRRRCRLRRQRQQQQNEDVDKEPGVLDKARNGEDGVKSSENGMPNGHGDCKVETSAALVVNTDTSNMAVSQYDGCDYRVVNDDDCDTHLKPNAKGNEAPSVQH